MTPPPSDYLDPPRTPRRDHLTRAAKQAALLLALAGTLALAGYTGHYGAL